MQHSPLAWNRETLVRVTGGMKVKADRDEVCYLCILRSQDIMYSIPYAPWGLPVLLPWFFPLSHSRVGVVVIPLRSHVGSPRRR